jgi:hypothetical protein
MAGVKKIVPVGKVAGVTDSARGFFSWHALKYGNAIEPCPYNKLTFSPTGM